MNMIAPTLLDAARKVHEESWRTVLPPYLDRHDLKCLLMHVVERDFIYQWLGCKSLHRANLLTKPGLPTLPIVVTDTPDRGPIPMLVTDSVYPSINESMLDLIEGKLAAEHGLKVIPDGRPDAIMRLGFSSFQEHLESLTQVARSCKKKSKVSIVSTDTSPPLSLLDPILADNWLWFMRQEVGPGLMVGLLDSEIQLTNPKSTGFYMAGAFFGNQRNVLRNRTLSRFYAFDNSNNDLLGICVFEHDQQRKEVYWINSFMKRNDPRIRDYSLGNLFILRMLELCYQEGIPNLNLGLALFDYKTKAFKAEVEMRRGLSYANI